MNEERRLKKELLGRLIKSTDPSMSYGDSAGLITKIEKVDGALRVWSLWPATVPDLGWGVGVVWHVGGTFKNFFEVIQ